MNLKVYFVFKSKIKNTIFNHLPNDLKLHIWDNYKIIIAYNIIKNFIRNNSIRCNECQKYTFIYLLEHQIASSSDVFNGTTHTLKTVCKKGCNLLLSCNHRTNSKIYTPYNYDSKLDIYCHKCNIIKDYYPLWYGISTNTYYDRYM